MDYLKIIGRNKELFDEDIIDIEKQLSKTVSNSSFLVIGGAGSIGRSVVKEIFRRNPKVLHVVDLSENSLVELVRDLRSTIGYSSGEFKTFAIDCGSLEFEKLISTSIPYDYILNLSALKHVRSEKDPFTLMRMIDVNILNTIKTINLAIENGSKKYFCVSTDKAANPVNLMGASKRIMEKFLMQEDFNIDFSTARFANVAFSDGSLLQGFLNRFNQDQPIAAPDNICRYFVTPKESGELCLLSCIFGNNKEIFFPKLEESLHLVNFKEIAKNFLNYKGYEVFECNSEEEARRSVESLKRKGKWPCFFSASSTSGEKSFEEFFTNKEELDLERFKKIGIIIGQDNYDETISFYNFKERILDLKQQESWTKTDILNLFHKVIPSFNHIETGQNLDQIM